MSLELPLNFKNDIQSRDTALIPVVVIKMMTWDNREDISISTNVSEFSKPLLLNIPSLKESIDIERRNYKISSVNIDISNYLYEGERFSELVDGSSLINKEVDIYWTSPSTRRAAIGDLNQDGIIDGVGGEGQYDLLTDLGLLHNCINNNDCYKYGALSDINGDGENTYLDLVRLGTHLDNNNGELPAGYFGWAQGGILIYRGKVRRYTHDDEKVRLVVEDRSQATLHKDLPLSDNYLTGGDVPDKYKNKPIPMVYGHVDKSPCVIKNSPTIEDGYIGEGNLNVIIDSDNSGSTTDGDSLYIFESDYYINIPQLISSATWNSNPILGYANETQQYTTNSSNLIQFVINNSISENINPIGENYIVGKIKDNSNLTISPLQKEAYMIGDNDINNYYTSIGKNLNSQSYSDGTAEILGSMLNEGGANYQDDWGGTSFLAIMPEATSADIDYEGAFGGDPGDDDVQEICTVGFSTQFHSINRTSFINSDTKLRLKVKLYHGNLVPGTSENFGNSAVTDIILGIAGNLLETEFAPGETSISESIFFPHGDSTTNWLPILDSQDSYSEVVRTYTLDANGAGNFSFEVENGAGERYGMALKIVIEEIFLEQWLLAEDIIRDFYANVSGRAMNLGLSPTAPSAIKDILENELGQSSITAIETYGWQYAFTVDKKINSKKLIEGIASASPYIPRFNNMGEFKFDVIPDKYIIPDHTIIDSEIIDFSFSRTKIEDVSTKVVLKYNWDYAGEKFNNTYTMYLHPGVIDFDQHTVDNMDEWGTLFNTPIEHESYDYYGLKDDDSESTLIIDDDRGKYIRNSYTAYSFARWLLFFNINQHLKMKVKLPLKYMDIEIGDIVDFNKIINDIKPYGICYSRCSTFLYGSDTLKNGDYLNKQQLLPSFIVTSTNKTLEWVQLECLQLHRLKNTTPGDFVDICPEDEREGCGFFDGDIDGGTFECWDGTEVDDATDCPEGGEAELGTCIVDGVDLGEATQEECYGVQVANNKWMGKDIPEDRASDMVGSGSFGMPTAIFHLNSDGKILYNIPQGVDFLGYYFMIVQERDFVNVALGEGLGDYVGGFSVTDIPSSSFLAPFEDWLILYSDITGYFGFMQANINNPIFSQGIFNPDTGFVNNFFGITDSGGAMYGNINPAPPQDSNIIFIGHQLACKIEGCGHYNDDACSGSGLSCNDKFLGGSGVFALSGVQGYIALSYIASNGNPDYYVIPPAEGYCDEGTGFCDDGSCINCDFREPYIKMGGSIIEWYGVSTSGSGDLNLDGKADISDMVLMGNYLSGGVELTDREFAIADILRNNNVSILDIINLANMIVGGKYSG